MLKAESIVSGSMKCYKVYQSFFGYNLFKFHSFFQHLLLQILDFLYISGIVTGLILFNNLRVTCFTS